MSHFGGGIRGPKGLHQLPRCRHPAHGRLAAELRRVFGDEAVFLDYRSLDAGGQWPEQLQSEVAGADIVLVLIGKDWLTVQDEYGRRRIDVAEDWVRQEVAAGLSGRGKVLPLLVNDAKPIPLPAIENLPDIVALATAQARPLRDVDWEADFDSLADWLETHGFERAVSVVADATPTPAGPLWQGNPYRGLSAFSPEHSPIYFGRERETDDLLRRVVAERVVAVIGPSGSGKSSLVAAGLLPLLGADGEDWVWVRFTPTEAGDNPLRALARKLAPRLSDAPSVDALTERLCTSPEAIDALAAEALEGHGAGAQLLLFADQFEELFAARVPETNRASFVDFITAVAGSARVRMVLTLRADYTQHCTHYESLTNHLRDGTFLIGTPGITALQAMVERPARAAGLVVESALVDRILADAGTEAGALALVEFTLEQLYDARGDGTLTLAAYDALEGVGGAIEVQGEGAVGEVDETTLGNVFRAVAAVDEAGGAVRKRAPVPKPGTQERAIVDRLVGARLLVTNTDADGESTVEVAHEAVLRHWQRCQQWLDDNRALELWRHHLGTYQRGGALLPRGAPLATASEWLETRAADLSEAERAYIVRSRGAARRFYGSIVGSIVCVLFTIGAVAAFYVWTVQNNLSVDEGVDTLAVWPGLSGAEMVDVPGEGVQEGTFTMGSPETETDRYKSEGPQHKVTIPAFRIGKYEVTFAEYFWFAKDKDLEPPADQGWGRGNRPVINVTWKDAEAYAKWLTDKTGKSYRLPTEAEWEYAARAGTKTKFSFEDEAKLGEYAWFSKNSDSQTHEVGKLKPNPWGLHDMHGNVWEWVKDCWHENYENAPEVGREWKEEDGGDCGQRVIRGGSWGYNPGYLRSSNRDRYTPGNRTNLLGFRLAQDK